MALSTQTPVQREITEALKIVRNHGVIDPLALERRIREAIAQEDALDQLEPDTRKVIPRATVIAAARLFGFPVSRLISVSMTPHFVTATMIGVRNGSGTASRALDVVHSLRIGPATPPNRSTLTEPGPAPQAEEF